jgi:hypothetical protein
MTTRRERSLLRARAKRDRRRHGPIVGYSRSPTSTGFFRAIGGCLGVLVFLSVAVIVLLALFFGGALGGAG